jgi:hypothetical protein
MRRLGEQNRMREWAVQTALQVRVERAATMALAREFRRAMGAMLSGYAATGHVEDDPEHYKRLDSILRDDYDRAIQSMGRRIIAAEKGVHGPRWRKDIARPELFERLLMEYVAGHGDKITNMAETTKKQIVRALALARDEGLGIQAAAKVARTQVPALSAFRSALIARTETHSAAQWANVAVATETGLETQKEWIAAEDERTREDHADADGSVVAQGEAFQVGSDMLLYPGDVTGSAEQIINCRCVVGMIVV